MMNPGYRWTLRRVGDRWLWRAEGRDDRAVLMQGLASTKAEAAALLVRAISLNAAGQTEEIAA